MSLFLSNPPCTHTHTHMHSYVLPPAVTHCVQLQMSFIHNWGVVYLAKMGIRLLVSFSPTLPQTQDQWPPLFGCNSLLQSAGMWYSCQYLITKLCSKLPITHHVTKGSQSVLLKAHMHTHTQFFDLHIPGGTSKGTCSKTRIKT